jgi:hypothetical protein
MKDQIELINGIVEAACEHGGDSGGPYYSDWDPLYNHLLEWLKANQLDKDYEIISWDIYSEKENNRYDCPKIIKRRPKPSIFDF